MRECQGFKNIDIWAEVCYNMVAQAKRTLTSEPQMKTPRNRLSVGFSIRLEARIGPCCVTAGYDPAVGLFSRKLHFL